jgi:hypothetical protein
MQIDRVSVKTYFDKPKDVMTVNVDFSTPPDGTLYPALNSIEAPSKKLSIATVNSNFSKAFDRCSSLLCRHPWSLFLHEGEQ